MKNQTSKKRRKFIRKSSKIVPDRNGGSCRNFLVALKLSENLGTIYVRFRIDILQNTVVGCP